MSEHLELILDDLRAGLRRRAQRRRRMRAAGASVATTIALAAMAVSMAGLFTDRTSTAVAAEGSAAARLIADGCFHGDPGLVCWAGARN